jgi:hypothetical protein
VTRPRKENFVWKILNRKNGSSQFAQEHQILAVTEKISDGNAENASDRGCQTKNGPIQDARVALLVQGHFGICRQSVQ